METRNRTLYTALCRASRLVAHKAVRNITVFLSVHLIVLFLLNLCYA